MTQSNQILSTTNSKKTLSLFSILFLISSLLLSAETTYQIFAPHKDGTETIQFSSSSGLSHLHTSSQPGKTATLHPTLPLLYLNHTHKGDSTTSVCHLDAEGRIKETENTKDTIPACALLVDYSKQYLLTASYKLGHVTVHKLTPEGAIEKQTQLLDPKRPTAHDLCLTPNNKYFFLPFVKENNEIYQYTFDQSSGTLSPNTPLEVGSPEGTGPRNGFVHPDGKAIYFSNEQEMGVSAYAIKDNGTLSLIEVEKNQISPPEGAKTSASFMVGTPDAKFLFLGIRNQTEENLSQLVSYKTLPDLSVEQVSSTPFPDAIPWGANVSPCGAYLFVTSTKSQTLTAYQITESGALTELSKISTKGRVNSLAVK